MQRARERVMFRSKEGQLLYRRKEDCWCRPAPFGVGKTRESPLMAFIFYGEREEKTPGESRGCGKWRRFEIVLLVFNVVKEKPEFHLVWLLFSADSLTGCSEARMQ